MTPPNIYIASVCTGMVHAWFAEGLAMVVGHLAARGISFSISIDKLGDVVRARNGAVEAILKYPQYTHLLFLDSDMSGWRGDEVLAMLEADVDVVAGAYCTRGPNPTWTVKGPYKDRLGEFDPPTEKGLLRVSRVPTGFFLAKREVFEKIVRERPDLQINFRLHGEPEPYSYLIFDARRDWETGKVRLTDDFGFSETWESLGGEMYIYPDVNIVHHWITGNLANFKNWLEDREKKHQEVEPHHNED